MKAKYLLFIAFVFTTTMLAIGQDDYDWISDTWNSLHLKGKPMSCMETEIYMSGPNQEDSAKPHNYAYFLLNDSGHITEMNKQVVTDFGIILTKSVFKYSSTGDRVIQIDYNKDGVFCDSLLFKYGKGETDVFYHGSNGSKYKQNVCKYNKEGRKSEEVSYGPNAKLYGKTTYVYSDDGKKCAVHTSNVTNDYEYNSIGDIVKMESKEDNSEIVFKYKYQYDKEGNWTKLSEYQNGKLWVIFVRDIKYY